MSKLHDNKQWDGAVDGPIMKEECYIMSSFWSGNGVVLGGARTYMLI